MFEELFKDLDINEELIKLLEYEKNINIKKLKGKKLSKDEFFFDSYFIKPSTMLKLIYKRKK